MYWFSFKNKDLRESKATGEVVVKLLDPEQRYKLFMVVEKAVKGPLKKVTEEEADSDHRITGKTVVRRDKVKAGALHGIDQEMWEQGRENDTSCDHSLKRMANQTLCLLRKKTASS